MFGNRLRYLTKEGFRNVRTNKLMSLASVTVLMSCLVLIGCAMLLYFNVNEILSNIESQNIIMVYIQDEATPEQEDVLKDQILAIDNVTAVDFISRDEAYAEVLKDMGTDAEIMTEIDSSFLPDTFRVTIKDMSLFSATVSSIKQLDNVMQISQNSELADKLVGIRRSITYVSIGIIVLLFFVSLFIIANTVRITMFTRRLEISIMKAVGATNSFIRWPFLVEGMLLGFISSAVAMGILYLIYILVNATFKSIFGILGTQIIPFGTYALQIYIGFLAIGLITGTVGSSLSMGRYLKEHGSVVSDEI